VAQLWRSKLPAIVAKHSPVDANPRHRLVAEALVDDGPDRMSNAIVAAEGRRCCPKAWKGGARRERSVLGDP
jgi:hypothetical protein